MGLSSVKPYLSFTSVAVRQVVAPFIRSGLESAPHASTANLSTILEQNIRSVISMHTIRLISFGSVGGGGGGRGSGITSPGGRIISSQEDMKAEYAELGSALMEALVVQKEALGVLTGWCA